jgi:Ca-activated chloride channel family protein
MDEAKLKQILENMEVPPVDENARKRALNLAVAEFKSLENQRKNEPQGFAFFSRLMGKTTRTRRDPMQIKSHRKLVYGGMATAMAVVLIAGTTFMQYQKGPISSSFVNTDVENTVTPVTETAVLPYVAEMKEVRRTDAAPAKEEEARREMAEADSSVPMPQEAPAANTLSAVSNNMALKKSFFGGERAKVAEMPRAQALQAPMDNFAAAGSATGMIVSSPPPGVVMPEPIPQQPGYHDVGRDKFKDFDVSPVKLVAEEPVSTFSIDVDTSSYSFVRAQLNNGVLPQKDAVRVEEMINYFDYNYPLPETKEQPFKPTITVMNSPWNKDKKLVHIGIKGYDIQKTERPHSNLVFLLDVSGSMDEPNKLPLVKNSIKMLLDQMNASDKISIVVYAGAAGTVLEPTPASDKAKIIAAIDNLQPGGSTAGAEGINLAYQLAEQNFDKEGVNRVILATDGDFNVGITSEQELKDFIERKRQTGIFLSVLGFGQGNLNDSLMQTLAQNGNGTAAYIDNLNEARKVLVQEASSTLFPIAKDVKIQVEFNPALVSEYRLVGYETRALNREDFNNDKVDAGDIGAGHAVTAIYEVTPVGATPTVDPSRYAAVGAKQEKAKTDSEFSNELGFLKIRYKLPTGDTSKLITTPIKADDNAAPCERSTTGGCANISPSSDANWAVAVAGYAQLLKGDSHVGGLTYDDVIALAQANKGDDPFGYRAEFINLVRLTKTAAPQ